MKIAVLAHVRQPIAEPFQGGMEAHSWHLANGLTSRGHDVTLFASGDSDPRFVIDPVLPEHYERVFPQAEHRGKPALIAHVDAGFAAACARLAAGEFDIVHNNSLHRFPIAPEQTAKVPTVTSLHVPPFDGLKWFVQASAVPGHRITVTSRSQLAAWWPDGAPASASVLHNGIDLAAWPYRPAGDGGAVWCGRMTGNKGAHLAIDAARRAGIALTLYGPLEDADYWNNQVRPRLGGGIAYAGHVDRAGLAAAFGKASVLLFTPCWDEPFGLVAVEAMACGTPVAAFSSGAAEEVVAEAGCFAQPGDADALADAIAGAVAIPRAIPRARVERMFSQDLWLDRCETLYRAARAETMEAG